MKPQRLLLPLLLALATSVAGSARAADLDPATTKDSVSIQLPKGWIINPASRSVLAASSPKPDTDPSGKFPASLSITQDTGNKIDGNAQQTFVAKQTPGYRVVEQPAPITLNGMQGTFFGGTFKSGTVELRTRQYMFTLNNQVYTITFTSLNSAWANYKPLIEASVATFSIKK